MTQGNGPRETPQELARRIHLPIENIGLLNRAFTHRSYLNEHPEALEDNERLEFLGDAVLDLVVSDWLYHHYPEMREGELTRLRASVVSNDRLAEQARKLGFGRAIRLGRGEEAAGGRNRETNLSAVFEALMGALYLEKGVLAVQEYVEPLLKERMKDLAFGAKDPKSKLQEYVQSQMKPPPTYEVVSVAGPDHERTYEVVVLVEGKVWGRGKGSSIRLATKDAARDALKNHHLDEI
jgi:ribonuclease-3